MITDAEARKQAARLSQMWNFPREKPAFDELVAALQTADNEPQASKAVSDILDLADAETRCPMPAYLRRAIWDLKQREKPQEPTGSDAGEFDPIAAIGKMDPEFLRAYSARQAEAKRDPTLARFGPDGHTVETKAKAHLRAVCQRLARNPETEVKF